MSVGPLELILKDALVCALCEDAAPKLDVWCMECFAAEKGRQTPFALCAQCNADMHRPQKMATHRRQRFRCNTERMRTLAEMKLKEWPKGMPALCSLSCSNCELLLDDHLEAQWCQECALILCKDCSKDLHMPQKKRVHQRYPFFFRFIAAAHMEDSNGTIEEAASRPVTAASSPAVKRSSINLASASSSSSGGGSFKNAAASLIKRTSAIKSFKPTVVSDGSIFGSVVPGDVMQISEPALTGLIDCASLSFKNTFNDFDVIGSVQIIQICCGNKHAGAVTAGGSLFMWGSNANSELGVDTGEEKDIAEPLVVQIPGNKPVSMIACGFEHSVCITKDHKAFSWGSGLMGILGHQSDINREEPTEIDLHWSPACAADPNEKLVWVACGPHNTGIVVQGRADGKQLYTCGGGEYGTLGTGSRIPSLQPQLISVEDDKPPSERDRFPVMSRLCFGTNHAVAVSANGACFSWGSNSCGQLGYCLDGQTDPSVSASASAAAVAAASSAMPSLVKRTSSAQSGDLQLRPRCVDSLRAQGVKVTHAACSELSTSVLTDTGAVWSWGSGETHQLGIMDNIDYFHPVKAAVLGGDSAEVKAVSLAVGVSSCAAVTESGDVYMWGFSVEAPLPTIVSHLRSNHMQAIAIGAHDNVVCLTGVSNEIYEWRFTEEGDHPAEVEPKQNRALRGKRLVSISVGKGRCAAATAGGVLLEWGVDTRDPDAPDDEEFDPYRPREIRCLWHIADVRCSTEHSVALTKDGKVLTWGQGGMGRLGQSSDRDFSSPALVEALKDVVVTSVAIGPGNTGCTSRDFKAYVWGAGNSGQLGNNDIHPIFLPAQIGALQHLECVQLAFGNRHLVVLTRDGELYASGDNGFGQLGLGSGPDMPPKFLVPQPVKALAKTVVSEVACGDNITLALTADGRLFAWGAGETHQIPGRSDDVHTPVQIQFPFASEADAPIKASRIREISVANINCAALADNGTVWVWGFALGDAPARVEYMNKEGMAVQKVAMGPSYMMLAV